MRILQVVHQFKPEHIGGVELFTQRLCTALHAAGHEVAVFHRQSGSGSGMTVSYPDGYPIYSGWHGEMTPNNRFRATFGDEPLAAAFATVLGEFQPDIVHLQHLMGLPPAVVDAIKQANIPYVASLHDYYYFCANAQLITNYDQTVCDGPKMWINCARCALARANRPNAVWAIPGLVPLLGMRQLLLNRALSKARSTIVPTRYVAEAYGRSGISPPNIQVVPYGIDPPDPASQHRIETRQPWNGLPLRLVYIGGISWQKGVHVLVTAVNQLPIGAVTLIVYGSLESFPEYASDLRRLAAHPGIKFAGTLARPSLWDALGEADLLVVPSVWAETSAMVIDEAFAARVPVLASEIGGMREKIEHGRNGYLLPPGDSDALAARLRQFIEDPEELRRLQTADMPFFTTAQHTARTLAIYGGASLRY